MEEQHPSSLRLRGSHVSVDDFVLRISPEISQFVAEDTAWCFSYDFWMNRRPSRLRRRAHQHWLTEGTELFAERHHLYLTAKSLGL